jgi:hypothetical protein
VTDHHSAGILSGAGDGAGSDILALPGDAVAIIRRHGEHRAWQRSTVMPTKIIWVGSQHGFRPVVVSADSLFPSGASGVIVGSIPLVQGPTVLYTVVP